MSSVLDRECPQMLTNVSGRTAYSAYDQRMPAYDSVLQRMPACLKRIQPMPNLPLAYVSVYQRMSENFICNSYVSLIRNSYVSLIRNSYVSLIRNSVTGPSVTSHRRDRLASTHCTAP